MNKRKDIVPNDLKEYRVKAGLTQKHAALKINLSPGNQDRISKWQCRVATPSLDNLKKLCRIYNTILEELYPSETANI